MSEETKNQGLPLSNEVWYKVIQFVQLAMITGTDVADYLRQIKVKQSENEFILGDGQIELFDRQIADLLERVKTITSLDQAPVVSTETSENQFRGEFGDIFQKV